MRERRAQPVRLARARDGIERLWRVAEEVDVEDGFGVGEVQAGEFGVQAGLRGAEVGDVGGGRDAGADEGDDLRGWGGGGEEGGDGRDARH